MLLAMKDEAGSNLNNEENDFMLDTSYGEETIEELTVAVMLMARIQPADGNAETVPLYDAKAVNEVNASSKFHEQIRHKKRKTIIQTSDDDQINSNIVFDDPYVEIMVARQSIQTIHMLAKTPYKVYDLFLTAGLGYKNLERLKKAIAAQPKMIDITHLEDRQRRCMSDSQSSLREFYKTDVILMSASLSKNLKELKVELIEENQDLLITISELKNKLKNVDKRKNMNTKFDKFEALGTLLCVTPLPKNIAIKAKKVSNFKVNADRSKPVTSHTTPTNEQGQTQNVNVLARGMYRITKTETQTPDSKTNINVSNSTCVESFNSLTRQKSKDTKSQNRFLKNTNAKSSTTHVQYMSRSVSIDSNKCETMNSTLCHANKSVLNTKNVTVVNDGSNIICVSCGKDVFLFSHEKCVAHYALSRNSNVKRALLTTPIAAKSKNLGATSVVAKSKLSVANTLKAKNKVFSASSLSHDSCQSKTLSNYMKNKIATSRKWQRWFGYQQSFNWSPKSKTAQSFLSETKSRIRVIQLVLWIVNSGCSKHMTGNLQLLRNFVEKFIGTIRFGNDHFTTITGYGDYVQGNLTIFHVYYVEGLGHNLFLVGQFYDGDLEVAFRSNTCYVRNLEGDDLLTGSCDSNLYTISISEMAASSPVCIVHQISIARTPQQNGVVERQNQSLYCTHTWYNKTPRELIRGRKPNIQYLYVFGSLCYPTNDRDDLGKMKPKADIGIIIGYSESSRGFRIYNSQTKKIMETIHVKFDELTDMASACNNLEPRMNCMNFQDSLEDSQSISSKSDLDNLFGPLYEEYYATSSQEVLDNSAANTLDNTHTSPSSSIVVEEDRTPQIVSSLAEQVVTEPNSLVLNKTEKTLASL
ncbi:integrase, catalytic region, zinc finger, CCHC-type containing protein [Tanacetum coccineum]